MIDNLRSTLKSNNLMTEAIKAYKEEDGADYGEEEKETNKNCE